MGEESLLDVGNFIILLVSGAIIPLLLVLYKSRCRSICWGCIIRDVLPPPEEKKPSLAEANQKVKQEIKQENNISNTNNEPETESNDQ
jgi:hypothetical protein